MSEISTRDKGKVQFECNVINNSGTLYIRIPPEIANHLDLSEGDTLQTQAEHGDHGPYASYWNPLQQETKGE